MGTADAFATFEYSILSNLKEAYSKELYEIANDTPDSIVNFNNIAVLKKGQKYVKHTNLVFNKSLARLVCELLTAKGYNCKTQADWNGRSITIPKEKVRIHFLNQEKLVGFPKVPWMNNKENVTPQGTELYVILILNDEKSLAFIEKIQHACKQPNYLFITFEQFILKYFDKEILKEFKVSIKKVENESQKYRWFDLAQVYTTLNKEYFNNEVKEKLANFDYFAYLANKGYHFDRVTQKTITEAYLQRYELLLSDEDFSKSFLSSEWLYTNYSQNNCLDKTYIISGYLKAVEQLLYWIIPRTDGQAQIAISTNQGYVYVDVTSPDFCKATLGNMVYFLRDIANRGIFNSKLSSYALKTLSLVINEWVQKERNGYFHKHNIEKQSVVKEVRDFSLCCYFLILGAIK